MLRVWDAYMNGHSIPWIAQKHSISVGLVREFLRSMQTEVWGRS